DCDGDQVVPRALLSVFDKTGIVRLAEGLVGLGFEVVSTGNTLRELRAAGVPATAVADVIGFPEILGGRVKTLHPAIHGGILAKRNREHLDELAGHVIDTAGGGVSYIYTYTVTVDRHDVREGEALEQIEIGGPSMSRAVSKYHPWVTVVVDPADYARVMESMRSGGSADVRRR